MRLLKPLLIIFVIVALVHGAAWMFLATQAENTLRNWFAKLEESPLIETRYTVTRGGYPFRITLELQDLYLNYPTQNYSLTQTGEGSLRFHMLPSWPVTLKGEWDNTGFALKAQNPDGTPANMVFEMGTGTMTLVGDETNGRVETLARNLRLQGQDATGDIEMRIGETRLTQETVLLSDTLVDGRTAIALQDMMVRKGSEEIRFSYTIDLGYTRMPQRVPSLEKAFLEFQMAQQKGARQQEDAPIMLRDIKRGLLDTVNLLAKENSRLTLNSIDATFHGVPGQPKLEKPVVFKLTGDLGITPEKQADGNIKLFVSGIPAKALAGNRDEAAAGTNDVQNMLRAMLADSTEFTLDLETSGNMLVVNNVPMLPLIPLDTLINFIPEEVTIGTANPNPAEIPAPDQPLEPQQPATPTE